MRSTPEFKKIELEYNKALINFFQLKEEYLAFLENYEIIRKNNNLKGNIIYILVEQVDTLIIEFNKINKILDYFRFKYALYNSNDFDDIKNYLSFLNDLDEWLEDFIRKESLNNSCKISLN